MEEQFRNLHPLSHSLIDFVSSHDWIVCGLSIGQVITDMGVFASLGAKRVIGICVFGDGNATLSVEGLGVEPSAEWVNLGIEALQSLPEHVRLWIDGWDPDCSALVSPFVPFREKLIYQRRAVGTNWSYKWLESKCKLHQL